MTIASQKNEKHKHYPLNKTSIVKLQKLPHCLDGEIWQENLQTSFFLRQLLTCNLFGKNEKIYVSYLANNILNLA